MLGARSIGHARTHDSRSAGVSLISVMVYVMLIGILGGPIVYTVLASSRSTVDHDTFNKISERNRVARTRLAQTLRGVRADSLTVADGGLTLSCQFPDWFDGAAMQPGDSVRYRMEIVPEEQADGEDNNGNGLVDEGQLVFENLTFGEAVVICQGLDLNQSSFALNGTMVSVNLTNIGRLSSSANPHAVTYTMTVTPRN